MIQEHYYEVDVQWKKDRIGELSAPGIEERITCATPPEFPDGVAGIWSPEHLFAASINSCFMATFLAISHNFKLDITHFNCRTTVGLQMVEGRYQITTARINPVVGLLRPDTDREKTLRVLNKSKDGCLVTRSMKTEVFMNPLVQ